jgi:hypothetical protein
VKKINLKRQFFFTFAFEEERLSLTPPQIRQIAQKTLENLGIVCPARDWLT